MVEEVQSLNQQLLTLCCIRAWDGTSNDTRRYLSAHMEVVHIGALLPDHVDGLADGDWRQLGANLSHLVGRRDLRSHPIGEHGGAGRDRCGN